ncbi:MAG: conjugal transfer protein TraA [Mesorhizobium sp.]|uniref:conjugal transfer protein TraA n=1 Tax=Mesorhizobium sp. TaxID=1871066 RepID=UPI001224DDE6|nr:conjugal transfer protein TraA [Mesorhizobium sp.]TIL60587.1 MAG: conjugal transfer protein TraA [Mesorhizobium sp.]
MELFFGAFTSEWVQRRAALLHELSLGGRRSTAEEELRRRMKALAELGAAGGGGGGGRAVPMTRHAASKSMHGTTAKASMAARPMQVRLAAVAQGSQPAVVKMASYGGGARVGAMLNYVSRGGELSVENENGERIRSREDLAGIRVDWDHLFQNRTESRDIGRFTVEITASAFASDDEMHELVRSSLTSGFGDRRFAYAVEKNDDDTMTVQGVVILRSGPGERLTGDQKAAGIIQARYDASAAASEAAAQFSFQAYGNGVEYGSSKLRDLVEKSRGGDVRDDRGQPVADDKAAGDLVQKEWRGDLHSRKSRDVMHLIMSARAGTDVAAFEGAVRDFLADQFAGHRYVFAMHDPANDPKEAREGGKRPHVHAHAIVTMKSESGGRIETTPAVFRQWRVTMAEKARDHGIAMEMTDRREFASPPAFTRNQVRPVNREGRTEHIGTSEAAQARYDAKRNGRRALAKSDRSREYTVKATQSWQKIAVGSGDRSIVAYAAQQRDQLISGLSAGEAEATSNIVHADFGSKFRANLVTLQNLVLEGDELRETSRTDFEAYEKTVETTLFKLERSVAPHDRIDFDEIATLAREHVNQRRELMQLHEQRNEAVAEQGNEDQRRDQRGEVNEQWEAAITKHGEAIVEAANDVLMEIDAAATMLADLEKSEPVHDPETGGYTYAISEKEREETEQLRAKIERQHDEAISRAARLAIERNTYIREVAEQDPELQGAVDQAEKHAQRPEEEKDKTPVNVDTVAEQQRDLRNEEAERQPNDTDAREAHELASTVDATNRLQDQANKDKEAAQRGGETTRTDTAQQHIPRLEELEREELEKRERDRDDRER